MVYSDVYEGLKGVACLKLKNSFYLFVSDPTAGLTDFSYSATVEHMNNGWPWVKQTF